MGKAELTKTKRRRLFDAHYAKLKNSGLWLQLSPLLWTKLLTRRLMFCVVYTQAPLGCWSIMHNNTTWQDSAGERQRNGRRQTADIHGGWSRRRRILNRVSLLQLGRSKSALFILKQYCICYSCIDPRRIYSQYRAQQLDSFFLMLIIVIICEFLAGQMEMNYGIWFVWYACIRVR